MFVIRQEIFKTGVFSAIIIPIVIAAIMIVFYFAAGDMPAWTLIFLIIPASFAIGGQTTKLIVENDILSYHHGFLFKSYDEVSLKKVTQIVTRVVETWENDGENGQTRKTNKISYVLDESGRTFFSFPASLIERKNRHRFEEAINAINPNIEIL